MAEEAGLGFGRAVRGMEKVWAVKEGGARVQRSKVGHKARMQRLSVSGYCKCVKSSQPRRQHAQSCGLATVPGR